MTDKPLNLNNPLVVLFVPSSKPEIPAKPDNAERSNKEKCTEYKAYPKTSHRLPFSFHGTYHF